MHAMSVAAGFSDEKTIFQVDLLLEGSQVVFQPAIADFEHEVTGALDTFIGMLGLVARLRTHRDIVGYLEVPGPVGRVRNAATRSSGSDLADVIVDEEYRLMCEHLEVKSANECLALP